MVHAKKASRCGGVTLGDLVRIPFGLLLMYFSAMLVYKAVRVFSLDVFHVGMLIASILIGGLFLLIGFAMAFSWAVGRQKRFTRRRQE